jgi:hypothetical protein
MTIAAGSAALASDELNVHNADGTLKNSVVTEGKLSLSDVTTADVTTSAHGFVPKAPNDTTKFLRGDASWATIVSIATQAEQEAGSSTSVFTSPGRQQYHPSAAKAWIRFNGTGTPAIDASYNVTSITDVGTGRWIVNFTTSFSSANYGVSAICEGDSSFTYVYVIACDPSTAPTASAFAIRIMDGGAVGNRDSAKIFLSFFGDQ